MKTFDLGHGGITADRCYSALVKDGDKYKSLAYIKAFKKRQLKLWMHLKSLQIN